MDQRIKNWLNQYWFKLGVLMCLIIAVYIGTTIVSDEIAFQRNQNCAKLLSSIQAEINKTANDLNDTGAPIGISATTQLNKIFYSNKRHSCLYSWTLNQSLSDEGKLLAKHLDYKIQGNGKTSVTVIDDALTNEGLFNSSSSLEIDKWMEENK